MAYFHETNRVVCISKVWDIPRVLTTTSHVRLRQVSSANGGSHMDDPYVGAFNHPKWWILDWWVFFWTRHPTGSWNVCDAGWASSNQHNEENMVQAKCQRNWLVPFKGYPSIIQYIYIYILAEYICNFNGRDWTMKCHFWSWGWPRPFDLRFPQWFQWSSLNHLGMWRSHPKASDQWRHGHRTMEGWASNLLTLIPVIQFLDKLWETSCYD